LFFIQIGTGFRVSFQLCRIWYNDLKTYKTICFNDLNCLKNLRFNDIDWNLRVEISCLQARIKKTFFSISILFLSWKLAVTQYNCFWTWDIANQKFQKPFDFHLIMCYVCNSANVIRMIRAYSFALQMCMSWSYNIARAVKLLKHASCYREHTRAGNAQ